MWNDRNNTGECPGCGTVNHWATTEDNDTDHLPLQKIRG